MATDWAAMKVAELKDECRERGLPVSGKKADLVERLVAFEAAQVRRPAPPLFC